MTGFIIQQKTKLIICIKRTILFQLSSKQVTRWSRTQSFPAPSTKRSRSPSGTHPQQPPWPQWQWSAHKLRHTWPRQSGLRLHKTPSILLQHSVDQMKKWSSYKITILFERKTQKNHKQWKRQKLWLWYKFLMGLPMLCLLCQEFSQTCILGNCHFWRFMYAVKM